MRSTIDRAGRVVVPKPIREAANLRPGTEVEFRVQGGRVEIEPVPLTVSLQRRGSLVVAVPEADQPVMRAVGRRRDPRPATRRVRGAGAR